MCLLVTIIYYIHHSNHIVNIGTICNIYIYNYIYMLIARINVHDPIIYLFFKYISPLIPYILWLIFIIVMICNIYI